MGCHSCKNRRVYQAPVSIQQIPHFRTSLSNARTLAYHKNKAISRKYTIGPRLGTGQQARNIRKAIEISTGRQYVIETIKKSKLTNYKKTSETIIQFVEMLQQLEHPNIVKFHELYEDPYHFHVVQDYVDGGELFDYVVQFGSLSEQRASQYLRQLLQAMNYLHSQGQIHGNLKSESLLLTLQTQPPSVKLTGFSPVTHARLKSFRWYGDAYYVAPEVFTKHYDSKCDIWSCGVILFILLSGTPPFNGNTEGHVLKAVKKGNFSMETPVWSKFSQSAKALITSMLELNPSQRISAAEALQNEWILAADQLNFLSDEELVDSFAHLKEFRTNQKLRQAILNFISSQLLSPQEKAHLLEVFESIDRDGDGKLSRADLMETYRQLMTMEDSERTIAEIMEQVDVDENGYIEYSEFITAMMRHEALISIEALEHTFEVFDKNRDGKISVKELEEVLSISEDSDVWKQLIQQADANSDGFIDLAEFKDLMLRNTESILWDAPNHISK